MLRVWTAWGMGLILAVVMSAEISTAGDVAPSHDWPSWRGPQRDGKSTETGLLDHWDDNGPPRAWRIDGLGKGYSSVTIANGKIFTMGKRPQKQAERGPSSSVRPPPKGTPRRRTCASCCPAIVAC